MAKSSAQLLDLDIDELFENHKIEEILEIEKWLDSEIERKRSDLRSMVGDRYRDVLTASDAIKTMKTISENIVSNIESITHQCEDLLITDTEPRELTQENNETQIEERTLAVQLNLSLSLSEQIWVALDQDDNLKATQFHLLAQHIHTGLCLSRKEILEQAPIIKQIKFTLLTLKDVILNRIKDKLESVEITAEETSNSLNALLLIKNLDSEDLFSAFINHRKTALNTVINSSHSSVRLQISAMVRCLITTIHLLHNCFIDSNTSKKGLIWQQLDEITNENAPPIITKVQLPVTYLLEYLPSIVKEFRPQLKTKMCFNGSAVIENWLQSTSEIVHNGLKSSLELITNIKGLYIIREEALKIEPPEGWGEICSMINLPENFSVWYYFFQTLITHRARQLIAIKLSNTLQSIQKEISKSINATIKSPISEFDLRTYMWTEEDTDISNTENQHIGLAMKTKGYSPNIMDLCEKIDKHYLEILTDVSQYLYGVEYGHVGDAKLCVEDFKFKRKFIDREELENHLTCECSRISLKMADFISEFVDEDLKTEMFLSKSIMCARLTQAITELCLHFNRCSSFCGRIEYWNTICDKLSKCGLKLWSYWLEDCIDKVRELINRNLEDVSSGRTLKILVRWDKIEIQEQTEEKVFKSYIKVSLKPSEALNDILKLMNRRISSVLPHTLPKVVYMNFIERCVSTVFERYEIICQTELNQNQALQFLFDVKFLTTFCIPRDCTVLVSKSQNICDKMRSRIDPFDLDVFYPYLQANVKKAALQSQVILGCLLPSSTQLANIGMEKMKEQDKEPSLLALSSPSTSSWFPLLPITVPSQKTVSSSVSHKDNKSVEKKVKVTPKKSQEATNVMKSSAAALFGGFTSDWFS